MAQTAREEAKLRLETCFPASASEIAWCSSFSRGSHDGLLLWMREGERSLARRRQIGGRFHLIRLHDERRGKERVSRRWSQADDTVCAREQEKEREALVAQPLAMPYVMSRSSRDDARPAPLLLVYPPLPLLTRSLLSRFVGTKIARQREREAACLRLPPCPCVEAISECVISQELETERKKDPLSHTLS